MTQTTTRLIDNTILTYESFDHECRCRLRIYQIEFDRIIIIASNLPDNVGRSMSKAAEELIQLVHCQYNFSLNKMMWVEHYPSNEPENEDIYNEITFVNGFATWNPTSKAKLQEMLNVLI